MSGPSQLRIVLAGGSGQVGTMLARHFQNLGHHVCVLSRNTYPAPWRVASWDAQTIGPWISEICGAHAVINLAGRNVNCRYNAANRRAILESRVNSTKAIAEAIQRTAAPPHLWLNASTATIYRHSLDRDMDEMAGELGGNEPGAAKNWKFSIEVAQRWEAAFFESVTPATRKIALRSAMTMSPDAGGIFDVLLRLVRFRLGGAAAGGQQYVSWIHEADFLGAIEFLVRHEELTGVVNVSAPQPLPQRDFMRVLRNAWGTRVGLPATKSMLALGALLLRTEPELILKSRRVVPGRLLNAGFQFQFPTWRTAAQDLAFRWRAQRVNKSRSPLSEAVDRAD